MNRFSRGALLGSLCLGLVVATMPAPARAAVIGTEQMLSIDARAADLHTVQDFLTRDAVVQELQQLGADAAEAQLRVAALSDAELRQLAGEIRSAPAGAGALEVIGIVFIVLLILELVGVINVFSRF